MTRYVFYVVGAVLFLFGLILTVRYIWLKRQIRLFTSAISEKNTESSKEPVKIFRKDKDMERLAEELNVQLQKQQEFYAEYQRTKEKTDYMISGISHDFRTPLTSSLGYLQLIKKSGEIKDEETLLYLDRAIEKNRYLKRLSDDFFDVAKLSVNDRDKHAKEDCNVSGLLQTSLLQFYERINEKKLELETDIEEGVILKTDHHNLARIFDNLLSNSIKYGSSEMRIVLRKDRLEISNDTDDKNTDITRVFEPFYRSDSRNSEGSGLGLYIVKCLCDDLGYKITAEKKDETISFILSFL